MRCSPAAFILKNIKSRVVILVLEKSTFFLPRVSLIRVYCQKAAAWVFTSAKGDDIHLPFIVYMCVLCVCVCMIHIIGCKENN